MKNIYEDENFQRVKSEIMRCHKKLFIDVLQCQFSPILLTISKCKFLSFMNAIFHLKMIYRIGYTF